MNWAAWALLTTALPIRSIRVVFARQRYVCHNCKDLIMWNQRYVYVYRCMKFRSRDMRYRNERYCATCCETFLEGTDMGYAWRERLPGTPLPDPNRPRPPKPPRPRPESRRVPAKHEMLADMLCCVTAAPQESAELHRTYQNQTGEEINPNSLRVMLSRLIRLGMIENLNRARGRGELARYVLTARGEDQKRIIESGGAFSPRSDTPIPAHESASSSAGPSSTGGPRQAVGARRTDGSARSGSR